MTADRDQRAERLRRCNRLVLAYVVFDIVYEESQSFREDDIGADLAYLMGAIVDLENPLDSFVDWTMAAYSDSPPPLLLILAKEFPRDHVLWEFILIDTEFLARLAT